VDRTGGLLLRLLDAGGACDVKLDQALQAGAVHARAPV